MAALNASGVRVELRGGAMQLVWDMNSLIEIEDVYGSLDGFEVALRAKPFRAIRFAVWTAGTWLGDPADAPKSEAEVGERMDLKAMAGMSDAVADALLQAIGLDDGEVAESADPTKAAAATPSPS